MFAQVLGLDGLGVDDDFFAAGGDSIRAIQIAARLGERGISLGSAAILEHRTVAALAPLSRSRADAPHKGPVTGPYPLSPIQARFFNCFQREPHHYNQALLLRPS